MDPLRIRGPSPAAPLARFRTNGLAELLGQSQVFSPAKLTLGRHRQVLEVDW